MLVVERIWTSCSVTRSSRRTSCSANADRVAWVVLSVDLALLAVQFVRYRNLNQTAP